LSEQRETAYAKVNLALHVRERMPDGYHRIETIFAFCEHGDELTAETSDSVSLEVSGAFGSSLRSGDNLAAEAAENLRKASHTETGAAIQLNKQLPIAAGLGGGSADAAAALRLLNRLWSLNWSPDDLESVGRELSSDVPSCVKSETVRGDGRGDVLQPVGLGLTGTPLLLVNPRVELPTAQVFARWDGTDRGPLTDWRQGRNDLEQAARSLVPQIDGILAWLSAQPGATFVRMSGSGATCFAFFESEAQRDQSAEAVPREWWRLATRLR
jgi:4-diphosphocytidyl-2-C-methyl-D-erythritol kinase